MSEALQYRCIYQYELTQDVRLQTELVGYLAVVSRYILLKPNGVLAIQKTYSWNGASGPAIDTPNFMRASLVHDALYQLLQEGLLPLSARKGADKVLRAICKADGMSWFRRNYVYWFVRAFGRIAIGR